MALSNKKVRVMVVDDSAFMRVALKKMMESDPGIEIIDVAKNGQEAIEKIKKLKPDVITMDIEMPVMDGLSALKIIMKEMPLPVIMISSLTEEGADATFKALDLGAVDFIPKGGKSFVNLDIVKIGEQLREKVKAIAARHRLNRLSLGKRPSSFRYAKPAIPSSPIIKRSGRKECDLVVIGISTGGPLALNHMLPQLPADFSSSILIVQHMPQTFTGPFAKRLDTLSQISVKEAEHGDVLKPGCAYVAKGGIHMKLKRGRGLELSLEPEPSDLLFVPSVDVMMTSAAEIHRGRILGVIMTGMGNDGEKGMTLIKEKGGITLAQDEESCVVYGMPKSCVESQIIDHVVSLDDLAQKITRFAG